MKIFKVLSFLLIGYFTLIFINQGFTQVNDFEESVRIADGYFLEKDYINAKVSYEYASRLNPDEEYPKQKLQETLILLKEQMILQESYDIIIDVADELFEEKQYPDAIEKYKEAFNVFPDDLYANRKIQEAESIIQTEMNIASSFEEALNNGSAYFQNDDLENAKLSFLLALEIYPENESAKKKLTEVEAAIEKIDNAELLFNNYMLEGNRFFELAYYKNAQEKYELALEIYPDNVELATRMIELKSLLVKQESYDLLVEVGDEFYMNQDFQSAAEKYNSALKIFPSEAYPLEMLDKISNAEPGSNFQGDTYAQIIKKADQYFELKNYSLAKLEYEKALVIKPGEVYPSDKLKEINRLENEKKFIKEPYDEAIEEADKLYADKDYRAAINAYQHAADMRPIEQYPLTQIKNIEKFLEDFESNQNQYTTTIKNADNYYQKKNYPLALTLYHDALSFIPDSEYPMLKISEIQQIMSLMEQETQAYDKVIGKADSVLALTQYEQAVSLYDEALTIKPEQQYPKDKISEIQQLLNGFEEVQNNYNQLISEGDNLFNNSNLLDARSKYVEASKLMPQEKYPQERIAEIDQIINGKETELENSYQQAISIGDQMFDQSLLKEALESFEEALVLKPNEIYPKNKIEAIQHLLETNALLEQEYNNHIEVADQLFAERKFEDAIEKYNLAIKVLPMEEYPKQKIDEINQILQATLDEEEKAYASAIQKADLFFDQDELEKAKENYQEASDVKPDEDYPKQKIQSINLLLEEKLRLLEEYNQAITEADNLFDAEKYLEAKSKYVVASNIFSNEDYPKEKIAIIENLLQAAADEVSQSYALAIQQADELFGHAKYETAIEKYQDALKVKPDEAYPKSQISLSETAIVELEGQMQEYTSFITKADDFYNSKSYKKAKVQYLEALSIFPEENHPTRRVNEIDRLLDIELREIQDQYNQVIAEADKFYKANAFGQAIGAYKQANTVIPEETYPLEMIQTIQTYLAENAVRDLVVGSVNVNEREKEKINFDPITISDRKKSFIHIKIKNLSSSETKAVLSYGQDGSKNGGFVLDLKAGEEENEYIVPIGKQYKWFTESNNWISIYPENGQVEITLIQISRGK